MKKIALKLLLACLATTSLIFESAWADDLPSALCKDTDWGASISADSKSERILKSEKPGTLEQMHYSSSGSYIVIRLGERNTGIPDSNININETDRQTRISQEIGAVLQAVKAPAVQALTGEAPQAINTFPCVKYQQRNERSTITVSFPDKDDPKKVVKKSFIAGPAEHWYLSADMPITKAKQLKWDTQTNKAVEANTPQTFYLGLNLKFGDVYTEAGDASWYSNFTVKALAQVSGPTNSYGFGLGYDFGPVNVFVARVSTKNDGVSSPDGGSKLSTIGGVSFNLENGIKWLSGK
jgi:hypothetical protein